MIIMRRDKMWMDSDEVEIEDLKSSQAFPAQTRNGSRVFLMLSDHNANATSHQ